MHGRFTAVALVAMTAAAVAWFDGPAKAQVAARTVWDGVYSADQAESGKHRYAGPCGSCHGRNLEGGHIFGSKTRTAPALRGETFLSHWMGHSVGELFAQISTSMPLDHPGTLSDEVNTSILAFILQENGFPVGNRDLSADTDAMEKIQIAAAKK
jgi:mono/diheme cytochrome c family protein